MTELIAASVIHFYDTHAHRILCGVRGAEHRSTKHPRGVTCHDCVGLLSDRRAADVEAARGASSHAN